MSAINQSTSDPLAVARSLAPVFDSEAERAEADGGLTATTVEALHDSRLFWTFVPQCLGGAESSVGTVFEVIEEASRADGSTGWCLMAGATTLAIVGAFLGDEAVEQIFADPRAVTAGQVAPLGTAVAEGDGYRIQGRFGFSSGSSHANWILGGYREQRDGEPVMLEQGMPNVLVSLVPKSGVQFLGNWDVIGLSKTGSFDYAVPEQTVGSAFTFPLFTAGPQRGGPQYRIGVNGITCIAHSAFACGVARRALDEIVAHAVSRRSAGKMTLIDDSVFQYEYGQAEAALAAARCFALTALRDLADAAEEDVITQRLRAQARLATTHACTTADKVVSMAYRFSGSIGLRTGSAIHRCFRDMAAGEQHIFTSHNTWLDASKVYLGVARESLFL